MKPTVRWVITAASISVVVACTPRQTAEIPYGGVGSLVVLVADSTGAPRAANAFFAQDLRVTSEVVTWGRAGVWADEKGVAHLGAWRPGKYTLVVRRIGYYPERRAVSLSAGKVDTVRITLKTMNIMLQ